MLIHGHISALLLVCAIIPLIKKKNGKTDDSDNYRGIGLSSLFLKIYDWVMLIVFEKELKSDDNQFGFQPNSSTSLCSWTVIETINYFRNKGSSIYACLIDYRKAFDLVDQERMFRNLVTRKICLLFIRLMIVTYLFQRCYVKWNETRSYSFPATNGTRQGAIFSPSGGFNTYLDPLLISLRKSGLGCSIGKHYFGAQAYADDCILLALSIDSLQKMVQICEDHARENSLEFSTDPDPIKSKTVCISFGNESENLAMIKLNNHNVPWRKNAKHIGNTLCKDSLTDLDISVKRGVFIDQCMSINQEFLFASSDLKLKMFNLYNCHFSGSAIWNFDSKMFDKFINSFNMNIKALFDIPWQTHRWLCEQLSGCHMKKMIFKRYIKFINSIKNNCTKSNVKFLLSISSDDTRSNTGANLRKILLETGIKVIPGKTSHFELNEYTVYKIPTGEEWRFPFLCSLLKIRDDEWEVQFNDEEQILDDSDITHMIDDICTS